MLKSFQEALDNVLVEPVILHDGTPFVVDGVKYYQATQEGVNMLMGRFHAISDVLRRHDRLALAGEHIDTALASYEMLFRQLRTQLTIDPQQALDLIGEGLILTDRLKQRKTIGLSVEQVYEVASIWYFSEDEDAGIPDNDSSRKKILAWTNSENAATLYAFFLTNQLSNLLPYEQLSEASTLSYLQTVNQSELLDLTKTRSRLKTTGEKSGMMNTLELRTASLSGYEGLFAQLLSSTSTIAAPSSGLN